MKIQVDDNGAFFLPGQGDMAVSNSIGSNVFDILIGLALPWFIQTSLMDPGSKVSMTFFYFTRVGIFKYLSRWETTKLEA